MKPFDPPYTDLDIEQGLLGAIIKNPDLLAGIDLRAEQFFFDPHKLLFAEIKRIFAEKKTFGIPDLNAWAETASEENFGLLPDGVAGKEYIRDLARGYTPAGPLISEDWAFRLADLHRKRCIAEAIAGAERMLDTADSAAVIADLHRAISDNANMSGIKSQAQIQEQIRQAMILPPVRYSTGIKGLDRALAGGFYAGFTYGFCGAEKAGKTTLAHTISYQLDCHHLYVAMEMGAAQIEQRNMARQAKLNSLSFLDNAGMVSEATKGIVPKGNVFYFDAPGATIDEILYHISSAIIRYGIKGFIIDYWQLVGGQQRGETEEKHMRRTAQSLADFARKQKVWCVLLAQMNKDGQLFGGNGLRKACDQLYMIESVEGQEMSRWLRMDASRYTMRVDVGEKNLAGITLDSKVGPFFYDPNMSKNF